MTPAELAEMARAAAEGAHAPYSKFRVGAVAVGADGEVFTAANVENAAYPSGTCAEANAIHYSVAQGVREFSAVAVACIDADRIDDAYPCGRCRQIMSEFDVETVIVTAGPGTEISSHTLDELLPHRFRF